MIRTATTTLKKLTIEQKFMISCVLVNGGNYVYNLILGRVLGPEQFADAAVLITLLLVVSFMAMTFQLTTAKFAVLFEQHIFKNFIGITYKWSLGIGTGIGLLMVYFAPALQELFNTQNATMFRLFGIGIPVYFVMSVNRGVLQGSKKFNHLSITYQGEMLSRLVLTLVLLLALNIPPAISIAIGIVVSFILGLFPFAKKSIAITPKQSLSSYHKKIVTKFLLLTAFYEGTQIIINNSDILMVKHYFDTYEAGLYASLALIGRVVYFVAWMFVMLLLPKVVQQHKDGENHRVTLFTYVGYIGALAFGIVSVCYLFPEFVIQLMFGSDYLSIAPLLWQYAIATSLFAMSNIFAYYFLSLDQYIPVLLSGILGIAQVLLIAFFHDSLAQVVVMQIIAMSILLLVQLLFFMSRQKA